ncbi:MAG: hypothetical protein WCT12_14490 [Verrucomicrobiota bacterium]
MAEFDPSGSVFKSRPKSLATLLAAREERGRLWRPDELGAIFRHQMSAPVMVDLSGFDAATAVRLKTLSEAQGLLLKSFAELLHHPSPPVELLKLTKDFAKLNLDHSQSTLPTEIAGALYYTSIAAALVRLDMRISQLTDADLRRGLLWARQQAWIDEATKGLLDQALDKLAQDGSGGETAL